ncbi:hypothetical protein [Actinosynnema sp. NPDC020468]|uniref:hypothetical protein n=1 Tax=Actinosynnema sp. NPDC020468 TaxID=3154488 RepID=UPI00340AC6D0
MDVAGVRALVDLSRREQRERLVAAAGDGGWWLFVVQVCAGGADEDGRAAGWARLTAVVLGAALDTGGLSADEVAVRRASLVAALAPCGPPEDVDPSLRTDDVVRECLRLTGTTAAEVAATPWALRAEDVPVLRRLRRVRTLVGAALWPADHVHDAGLRAELAGWRAVLPRLP